MEQMLNLFSPFLIEPANPLAPFWVLYPLGGLLAVGDADIVADRLVEVPVYGQELPTGVNAAAAIVEAEMMFIDFKDKWGKKYPAVVSSWENNWLELTTYFSYPVEIRRVIYTTNPVEGYHRQIRKVTKTKTAYPTDDALRKIIYLATTDISKKWTMPLRNWAECISQFVIQFGDRLQLDKAM